MNIFGCLLSDITILAIHDNGFLVLYVKLLLDKYSRCSKYASLVSVHSLLIGFLSGYYASHGFFLMKEVTVFASWKIVAAVIMITWGILVLLHML
ncbi:hypothetical protein L1987_56367 [Smallanthus sonchifolius]|uniref:Uncharacterized protein n=1 Tax=Smallanthus sonchifolius TaxID=185202 RepID=A0ACB9ECV4_9ASTR|nr:hypothetical protein L1987_56367 [Smallanthus sonchifolius]